MPLADKVDTIQKAYVNKVIDTVADLDNVLFEISMKANPTRWIGNPSSSATLRITSPGA